MDFSWRRMVAMLSHVQRAGWMPSAIAAFSAGMPKASHPMGCSTSNPRARL